MSLLKSAHQLREFHRFNAALCTKRTCEKLIIFSFIFSADTFTNWFTVTVNRQRELLCILVMATTLAWSANQVHTDRVRLEAFIWSSKQTSFHAVILMTVPLSPKCFRILILNF